MPPVDPVPLPITEPPTLPPTQPTVPPPTLPTVPPPTQPTVIPTEPPPTLPPTLPPTTTQGILTIEPLPTLGATTEPPTLQPEPETTPPLIVTTTKQETKDPVEEPLATCPLNCYGDDTVAASVALDGGSPEGFVTVESEQECRQRCFDVPECGAVVYQDSSKACWGKKEVDTYRCPSGAEEGFVTDFVKEMPKGNCAILGDPHGLTFDNSKGHIEDNTILHHGYYNLVEAPGLLIQGSFGYTKEFPSASSMNGIAVSGTAIGGNTLTLAYKGPEDTFHVAGFEATWNGDVILAEGIGAKFEHADMTAECDNMEPEKFHNSARHTYGGAPGSGHKPSYLFTFTNADIEVYFLVGEDAGNAVITMRKREGMDGFCGNFDCDPEDDTLDALKARNVFGTQKGEIGKESSLFSKTPDPPEYQVVPAGPVPSLETCDKAILDQAEIICQHEGRNKKSCMLDECAKAPAFEAQRKVEVGRGFALQSVMASIPGWFQATLAIALVGLFGAGVTVGMPLRRRHRLYDTLSVEEGTERTDSRTMRMPLDVDTEPSFFDAPLQFLSRSALAVTASASGTPLIAERESDEEGLLDSIAFEHEPI